MVDEVKKEKNKPNFWLEDDQFISKMDFHDKFYIKNLCNHVAQFLKTIPIPVLTTWDPKYKRIYFHVGLIKNYFEVDENVNYWDYTTLVKRWLKQFFPQYNVKEEKEIELSDDEIQEKVKEGIDINDALQIRKKGIVEDKGIITKIFMVGDQFLLEKDNKEFIRISGTQDNLIPLSKFLKQFRTLTKEEEKRDFIYQNSEEIKRIHFFEKSKIVIDYEDSMMMNFFIINYPDLKDQKLKSISTRLYYWGRFQIVFNGDSIERECISYVNEKRAEEILYDKGK